VFFAGELLLANFCWESSWNSPAKYLLDENGNQETAAFGRPALLPELCFLLESLLDSSWFPARYMKLIRATILSKRS
jgi:hypothetical protein